MKTIDNRPESIKWPFGMLAVLLALLPLMGGCDDFVTVAQPDSQLSAVTVYQDKATANAALLNIYAQLRDSGMLFGELSGVSNTLGNYADELDFYGSPSDLTRDFYTNNLLASNATVANWWANAYAQVYAANAVLEGTAASTALSGADKAALQGEALFLRALLHFYLTGLFGEVPYITTTDYRQNSTVVRSGTAEAYQAMVSDLTQAMALLPEPDAADRSRANKAVAAALLARVYLYGGEYAGAADTASYVINNTAVYTFESDIADTFGKGSTETIWHFSALNEGNNAAEGHAFIFNTAPPPQVALSTALMEAFEPGDLRREYWTRAVTESGATYYQPYKYREQSNTPVSLEYSVVLRLAEQYLVRAEARAMQGELIGAKEDINALRARAGLPPTPAGSQQELITAVLNERRVELFTEYGHRFFDLKRKGLLDSVLAPVKAGWKTTGRLLPIPETELLLNPNIGPQNAGY